MAESRKDDRERTRDEAQPQDDTRKYHGDKLDPVLPRGADQKGDEQRESRLPEEHPMTGDRGRGAR